MSRVGVALGLFALGCSPLPLPPFELDVSSNCNEVVVETIRDDLDAEGGDDWLRVLAAASDWPGSESAWLLVVAERDDGEVLAVVHLGEDGVVVVDELPNEVEDGDDLSFVAGPTRGQAWLVEESPGVYQLRRYDAEPAPILTAVSIDFIQAPDEDGVRFPLATCVDEDGLADDCAIDEWPHELVFLEGMPYLLSLPPSSTDASVDVIVGSLTPDLERIDRQETLNFAPDCDQTLPPEDLAQCEADKAATVHPALGIIGIQPDTRPPTTSLALYRDTLTTIEGVTELPVADVAFVILGHDKLGHPAGNLVSEPTLVPPTSADDGAVVIDSRAMYVQYESSVAPVIVKKSVLGDEYDTLTNEIEVSDDSTMLQLDEDLALGRVTDGVWEIVKLFPDAPDESRPTIHDPGSEVEAVSFAGPGSFLVHEADGGPDLVRLRCTNDLSAPQ